MRRAGPKWVASPEVQRQGFKFFKESLRILGMCVREAPEFDAKKRMKAARGG